MVLDWQQIFYLTTSIAMVVITLIGIFYFWIFFNVFRLLKRIRKAVEKGDRIIEDIDYIQRGIKRGIIGFLLKIFEKGDHNV